MLFLQSDSIVFGATNGQSQEIKKILSSFSCVNALMIPTIGAWICGAKMGADSIIKMSRGFVV